MEIANQPESDIYLGQIVNNEDEAYALYTKYAYQLGFSKIRTKEYVCAKQGTKYLDEGTSTSFTKMNARTNCEAMVRFTIEVDGLWKITKLITEHNHELVKQEHRHLMRSARNIPSAKGDLINSMVTTGIRTKDVWSYLGEETHGFDNIGFSKKDCYNYVNKQKLKLIKAGDGKSLVNLLQSHQAEDPMFYYSVQFDEELHLTNVFWRDGRSTIDYDCFGDVVVFDTTYRTNKYDLICGPFVGINHHWQNVMFGCAFLMNESAESFEWLFDQFLKSMGNRPPQTIVTDQDAAMAKAIEKIFPNTRHRLCLWHISKNAPSHLGSLNCDSDFQSYFQKCMRMCDSEEEFEITWDEMIRKFELNDHKWLNRMYTIRHKWSTAFGKDMFSANIKSSQRSESTNSVLGEISTKKTSLTEFFLAFKKMVEKWRSSEGEEDFHNSQSIPSCAINRNRTLCHASKIYTKKIFKLFEREYLDGVGTLFKEIKRDGDIFYYELWVDGKESKRWVVQFNSSNENVTCSCKKFESMGILCAHALRVYNIKCVTRVPDKYFLKRWSKNAKFSDCEHKEKYATSEDPKIVYRNSIMRSFYNLVLASQDHKETQDIMWDVINNGSQQVQERLRDLNKSNNVEKNKEIHCTIQDASQVGQILDPPKAKPKGGGSEKQKGVEHAASTALEQISISQSFDYTYPMVNTTQVVQSSHSMIPHAFYGTWNIRSPFHIIDISNNLNQEAHPSAWRPPTTFTENQ
ncbi:protein FAR1-RELATED SEQUENCE 5-like [Neltuma alba]|uniref:protein FAR1-RELATED SEQUENCE 5-like n=1 Tax=Neltuma alba TaxID=207710 RepID=UPI0010A50248|nr:protein FAR1-RELATED SEQUENCE 5-like [Prosopis alba]